MHAHIPLLSHLSSLHLRREHASSCALDVLLPYWHVFFLQTVSDVRKESVRLDPHVMTSIQKLAAKMASTELERLGCTQEEADRMGVSPSVIADVKSCPVPIVQLRNTGHLKLHNIYSNRQSRQHACVYYMDASGKMVRSIHLFER